MSTAHFTDNDFDSNVVQSNIPVLVDFFATWCGPCRMMSPVIDELSDEYAGKVKIGKLDVDENPQTSIKFGVQSVPTLVFFKNGEVVNTVIGFQSKESLKNKLDAFLK